MTRVLLVEDDPIDATYVKETLEDVGHALTVAVVHDGSEAIEYLRRQGPHANAPRPDLILLDLNLPRQSGFEVLNALKHDRSLRAIPIIILTSSDEQADVWRGYHQYANAFMTKPRDPERFRQHLRSLATFFLTAVMLPPGEPPSP